MEITVATWKTSRFVVSKGPRDWMVYDQERKAPALAGMGTIVAVNLTHQQANQLKLALMASEEAPSPMQENG